MFNGNKRVYLAEICRKNSIKLFKMRYAFSSKPKFGSRNCVDGKPPYTIEMEYQPQ